MFGIDVNSFLKSETLQAEVFGSSSLIVRCADPAEMQTVAGWQRGEPLRNVVHGG